MKALDHKNKNSKVIRFNKSTKSTIFKNDENKKDIQLSSGSINLSLDGSKGLSLKSFSYKEKTYLGTIEHGYFDDISFAADFYSGIRLLSRSVQENN